MARIISRVNKTEVSPDLLAEVVERAAELQLSPSSPAFASFIVGFVRKLPISRTEQKDLSIALDFRMAALAQLLREGVADAWTQPHAGGYRVMPSNVVSAAADEDLVEIDGELTFDVTSFQRRLSAASVQ